jgi:hypothetical protein
MSQFVYLPKGDQAVRTFSSAQSAVVVSPSDTNTLAPTRGLYIGGAGNIAVTMSDGTTVTFTGVTAGVIFPVSVTQVKATGTTATNIVAVY